MVKEKDKLKIKEKILQLNFYMVTAIDIHDEMSVQEIRKEISELIKLYFER